MAEYLIKGISAIRKMLYREENKFQALKTAIRKMLYREEGRNRRSR